MQRRHHVAIDFDMIIEPPADPKDDRVEIGVTGKFLPFKVLRNREQALEHKDE